MNLVDIGNRVFDQLVSSHGEDPTERLNFFHCIMSGQPWFLKSWTKDNPDARLSISKEGIWFGLEDAVIDELNLQIRALGQTKLENEQADYIKGERAEREKAEKMLKDGAIYNFWENGKNSTNIEIIW